MTLESFPRELALLLLERLPQGSSHILRVCSKTTLALYSTEEEPTLDSESLTTTRLQFWAWESGWRHHGDSVLRLLSDRVTAKMVMSDKSLLDPAYDTLFQSAACLLSAIRSNTPSVLTWLWARISYTPILPEHLLYATRVGCDKSLRWLLRRSHRPAHEITRGWYRERVAELIAECRGDLRLGCFNILIRGLGRESFVPLVFLIEAARQQRKRMVLTICLCDPSCREVFVREASDKMLQRCRNELEVSPEELLKRDQRLYS